MKHARHVGSLLLALTGLAGPAMGASLTARPASITLHTTPRGIVSLSALADSAQNLDALQLPHNPAAIEMPRHRWPNVRYGAHIQGSVLPAFQANSRVEPQVGTPVHGISGFTGIYEGANAKVNNGGELEPPDQGLAVNGGKVVEIVNNTIQVFTAGGKPLLNPVANATFFGTGNTYNLADPHVVFDPSVHRWFVEELMYSSTFNGFAIAVSKTIDPTGSYYLYYMDAGTASVSACGGSCLPDYPQVGFDKNGFYIAADLFSNSSGAFVSTALYALPKSALTAGAGFSSVYFLLPEFVLQPCIPAPGQPFETAANGTEYLMTARNIEDGSSSVRVWAISNTANLRTSPGTLIAHSADVAAESYTYTVPSTQPNVVGPYGRSVGATSAPKLDSGYNAFGGGVKYSMGNLYGSLATAAKDSKGLSRDILAWFVITPKATATSVSASIHAQGYVIPPDGYSLSYPSFAINASGFGIIGASITNTDPTVVGGYPSTGFIDFLGTTTSGSIYVSGAGTASDDGFSGYSGAGSAKTGRWGDYAGGTIDPATGIYYVANEFIPNATSFPRGFYANWGTYITRVR